MAIRALSAVVLLLLLAAAASARPCKTLFFFSATTTTTYYPHHHHSLYPNPNPHNFHFRTHNPRFFTLIFTTTTTTTRFPNHRPSLNFLPNNAFDEIPRESTMTSSDFPMKFYSSVSTSIRDRARDIMSVVGALLFGVGCGALTGAALYFVWALFFPRHFGFEDVSDDDEEEDYDDATVAKKLGYVAIPAKANVGDDDLKKPAKEVV